MTGAEIIAITKLVSDQLLFWSLFIKELETMTKEEAIEKIEASQAEREALFADMGIKREER